jgi:predicted nuclease with TOPRIM domain
VGNIEEKEKEILVLRSENKKIDQSYQNIREEYRELKRQLEEAERDVERLLVKRESIANIQNILVDLTRGPTSATQINAAIEDIRDILGSTSMKRTGGIAGNTGQKIPSNEPPSWYKKLVDKKK